MRRLAGSVGVLSAWCQEIYFAALSCPPKWAPAKKRMAEDASVERHTALDCCMLRLLAAIVLADKLPTVGWHPTRYDCIPALAIIAAVPAGNGCVGGQ